MQTLESISRIIFGGLAMLLVVMGVGMVAVACYEVVLALTESIADIGANILGAIGYAVIAIAIFDVAKYIWEEETLEPRPAHIVRGARQRLTKFVSTIIIVVFLEAIVTIFVASKTELSLMIYPVLLLLTGVILLVGLGVYLRLSGAAETLVENKEGKEREISSRKLRKSAR